MEYTRFGNGWVRRESADHDWVECPLDDLPAEVLDEERKRRVRKEVRHDPWHLVPFAQMQANPEVESLAAELGLSAAELRDRVNGKPGGTRARVSEERFDEIAQAVGLDPVDARDRFADRA